jgi:hypothetical protein
MRTYVPRGRIDGGMFGRDRGHDALADHLAMFRIGATADDSGDAGPSLNDRLSARHSRRLDRGGA